MNYKKMLFFSVLVSSSAFALDLQNKFRNSDKSLFETISDYQTIDPGRVMFSTGYSLQSRPLVNPANKDVLVDGISEVDFSMITGITKRWELGIVAPMTKTAVTESSPLESFSGFSDVYFESKFRLFNNFAIVPTYIYQTGEGLATSGSNSGGYGLKVVGSFFEESVIPIYYSIGRYYLSGTEAFGIDQSERTQIAIGSLKNLTKEISVGLEYFNDIAKKKHSPKELMAHATINTNVFSVRAGVGSGFLNSDRSNETRFFASLIFDLDFRKNKKTPEMVVPRDPNDMLFSKVDNISNGQYLNRMPNSITEEKIPTKEEVKKQMQEFLNKSSLSKQKTESGSLEEYTILPFYSSSDLRKEEPKKIEQKSSILSGDEKKMIVEKYKRLQSGYRNLHYNVDIYSEENKTTVIKELNWALRVVNMRKDTMKELEKQFQDKNPTEFEKELSSYLVKTEKEQKAIDILKAEQATLYELVKNYKNISVANVDLKKINPTVEEPKKEEPKKEEPKKEEPKKEEPKKESVQAITEVKPDVKPIPQKNMETEEQRVERLTRSQAADWEKSKKQTYLDVVRKKKGLPPKENNLPIIAAPKNELQNEKPILVENTTDVDTVTIKEDAPAVNNASELPMESIPEVKAEVTIVEESSDQNQIKKEEQIQSLTVPSLNELVNSGSGQADTNLDQKVQTLLNKIQDNNKTEKIDNYNKFYETYQKTVEESKVVDQPIKTEDTKNKELKILIYQDPVKELQKIEDVISKDAKNKQEGTNSIELQDFKVNSIEARFEEYKRKKKAQEAAEAEPSVENNVNSEEGLMESGEIEFSTGPSY